MTKALAGLVALAGAVIAAQAPAPRENPPPLTPEDTLDRRTIGDRRAGDLSLNRLIAWYDTDLKPAAPSPAPRP